MSISLFGVTGNPILHSLSPLIFKQAFALRNISARYTRVHSESAREALQLAQAIGMRGLNVTSPLKQEMAALLTSRDSGVVDSRAVNTVVLNGSALQGFNTDIDGVLGALRHAGVAMRGNSILVLGAGGAGRAAVAALRQSAADVTIVNRTFEKADELARQFHARALSVQTANQDEILKKIRVIINTLSCSESPLKLESLSPRHVLIEAQYGEDSELCRVARQCGAMVIDGRVWLLHQARSAFQIFTGIDFPDTFNEQSVFIKPTRKPIALIGMMGAGKSSVAQELGTILGQRVFDLDQMIEERSKQSVPDIFRNSGEDTFRDLESELLKEAVLKNPAIISCGGGVVIREENRRLLEDACCCLWLWADASELKRRISESKDRPLLQAENSIDTILSQRLPLYAEVADMIIPTENHSIEEVAKLMAYETNRAWKD